MNMIGHIRLREDDKMILECLASYGPLREEQLRVYADSIGEVGYDRIISDLTAKRLVIRDGVYVALDRFSKPDDKMIRAFWVFLECMKGPYKIRPDSNMPAYSSISQIFFIKNDQEYEIAVIDEVNIAYVAMLKKSNELKYVKHIIVTSGMDAAKRIYERYQAHGIVNKVAFAIIGENNKVELFEPEVKTID